MTTQFHETGCPLCGANATYFFSDYENRKRFTCPNCKEFEISKFAEDRFAKGVPQSWYEVASAASKACPEGTFYALTAPLSRHRRDADTLLVGERVRLQGSERVPAVPMDSESFLNQK